MISLRSSFFKLEILSDIVSVDVSARVYHGEHLAVAALNLIDDAVGVEMQLTNGGIVDLWHDLADVG